MRLKTSVIQYDSKFELGGCDEEDCEIGKSENVRVIREVPMLTQIATRVIYLMILTYHGRHYPLTRNADLIEKRFHAWKRD